MSKSFNEFNYLPNDDFFEIYSPQNDESIESENDLTINILSDKLFCNIYKMNKSKEQTNSFTSKESEISSSSKKENPIDKSEQINEIKYKSFMIMKNKCSYNDEYQKIFSLSNLKYVIKLRRLVIQKMIISNGNQIIYEPKNYIFFTVDGQRIVEFDYNIDDINRKFEIAFNKKKTTLQCDGISLKREEIFDEQFPEIKKELLKEKNEKNKKEHKNKTKKENKIEENNVDEKQNDINKSDIKNKINEKDNKYDDDIKNKINEKDNKYEDDIKNTINEQDKKENKLEENNVDENQILSDINKNKDAQDKNENKRDKPLKDDNSEDEVKQELTFYLNQGNNIYYRFVYCNHYEKEVDDIYTTNSKIHLNIEGQVGFENMINNLENNYNTDNDLKSYIIYKNFKSNAIKENTPMFLEVKKGFDLFGLLLQIKQNIKIINYLKLNNNIKLPQLIIGMMCNYELDKVKVLYNKLNQPYKNGKKSILEHNLDIINKEIDEETKEPKIQVVIGAIRDGKIGQYYLNAEDYDLKDPEMKEKSDWRVDLNLLNKYALNNSCEDEYINSIKDKLSQKYKSFSYEKIYTLSSKEYSILSSSSEENKQLKEKLKEMEEEKKEMEKVIEKKEEEKKEMKKVIEKKEEEKKEMKKVIEKKEEEMKKMIEKKEEEKKEMEKMIEKKEVEKRKMIEEMKKMIRLLNKDYSDEDIKNQLEQLLQEKK